MIWVFIIFLVIFILSILLYKKVSVFRDNEERINSLPTLTAAVSIAWKKRTIVKKRFREIEKYDVMLMFPDGKEEKITVNALYYNTLASGDEGIFTYKQDNKPPYKIYFIKFERNR